MARKRSSKTRLALLLTSVAAAAACIAVPAAASAAAVDNIDWKNCDEQSVQKTKIQCAQISAPLDHSGATPGQVRLNVRRPYQPAKNKPWLLYLSGGPGGAGVMEFDMFGMGFSSSEVLKKRFNLMAYDQRGTGRSGALDCPATSKLQKLPKGEMIKRCSEELGSKARFHSTSDSVEDIEFLRKRLGLEKLTLFGTSYGTKLALAYAAKYPNNVGALILDGVVDPFDQDVLGRATVGTAATAKSIADYCNGGKCPFTKDALADIAKLSAKLRARPMVGMAPNSKGKRVRQVVTAEDVVNIAFSGDGLSSIRFALPAAVKAALQHNDPAPLLRLSALAEGKGEMRDAKPEFFSIVKLLATNAIELPAPWAANTPVAQRKANLAALVAQRNAAAGRPIFYPFDEKTIVEGHAGMYTNWPQSGPVKMPIQGPYPAVPTLIYQGEEDTRTPLALSQRVAAAIPGAKLVTLPGVGHCTALLPIGALVTGQPESTKCAEDQLKAFLDGKPVATTCPSKVPFKQVTYSVTPKSGAGLKPAKGVSRKVGLTVAAVQATLADYSSMREGFPLLPVVGLRSGEARFGAKGNTTLKNFSAIQGVTVNGTVNKGGQFQLKVSGSKASRGQVRVDKKLTRLSGRIEGRMVSCQLGADATKQAVCKAR